jgi:hypothetical protein
MLSEATSVLPVDFELMPMPLRVCDEAEEIGRGF